MRLGGVRNCLLEQLHVYRIIPVGPACAVAAGWSATETRGAVNINGVLLFPSSPPAVR